MDKMTATNHPPYDERMKLQAAPAVLPRWLVMIFAVTCGISVANIYYAQPLLDAIASDLAIDPAKIGLVVTLTQVGYAAGLFLVVPLGDLVDRRKLILSQTILSAIALALVGLSHSASIFFSAMIAVGLLAVVVQVLVAFTASLAAPAERGRAVGLVTSGVVTGILAARSVAGLIADFGGWRAVYLTSATLMLVMATVLFRVLPRQQASKTSDTYATIVRSIPALFLHDGLLRQRAIFAFFVFASFSTLWTAMVLPLSSAPYELSHTEIGLFGLAGLAGALAANAAGRLADRGFAELTTGLSLALLTLSWLGIGFLPQSLLAFLVGVILLDFAVQAVHVTNQSVIFAARPNAHSRLVGGYMIFYSLGSAVGAVASTTIYASCGWTGVSILGAAFSGTALLFWLVSLPRAGRKFRSFPNS